jgi:hypothetical protein
MPLASSREASIRRAERVSAEASEHRRRERLSLPTTIDSATVATEAKARRRQSTRRDSIAAFKARAQERLEVTSKENSPPAPYSPPLTRSTKKARKGGFLEESVGLILSFSPPNQEENARRERKELEKKEGAR